MRCLEGYITGHSHEGLIHVVLRSLRLTYISDQLGYFPFYDYFILQFSGQL